MTQHNWDPSEIFSILDTPQQYDFESDVTVLKIDEELKVVLGYREDGSVFFGCPQIGEIDGFKKGRARLDVMQTIDLQEKGKIEPALALSFLVDSQEELWAISTIFSGLYDLNKENFATEEATLAAQGFKEYFAELPKLGLTSELEIGLFGELSIIATSKKKEELIRGWHASPNSTYDFGFKSERLEVKTSTRPTRITWLRSSQSIKNADPNLTYLSIYAPLDDAGLTLKELANEVKALLSPTLGSIFDEKLAFYEIDLCKRRFDYKTASQSFRFVSAIDVPYPISDNPNILETRWKCSFEKLPMSGEPSIWL